jgi:Nuclease-related domain
MLLTSLMADTVRRRPRLLTAVARLRTEAGAVGTLGIVAAAASNVQNWATGADARRRTERVLRPLERAGWRVHDIERPAGGSFDHVMVGPGGLFVLASKAWNGVVTVDHKGATITPPDHPDAAWTARGQHRELPPAAAAVVRMLSSAGHPISAPSAVVVVWAPFPERVAASGGVTYVAGDALADWLADQRPRPAEGPFDTSTAIDATGRSDRRPSAVATPSLAVT